MRIAGRSLERILRVAQATGYLKDFPPPIGFDDMKLPKTEVLIIATGGQGEPRAALGRIAGGTHELKLWRTRHGHLLVADHSWQRGWDRVETTNQLSDFGVQIVTEKQAHVE